MWSGSSILDVDVSAEYDRAVTHWEESYVRNPESHEISTIGFYSVARLHIEDITVANVVEIFDEGCPQGYLDQVRQEKHRIYESKLSSSPEQRQEFEDDKPGQCYTVVSEVIAGINYLNYFFLTVFFWGGRRGVRLF